VNYRVFRIIGNNDKQYPNRNLFFFRKIGEKGRHFLEENNRGITFYAFPSNRKLQNLPFASNRKEGKYIVSY